MRNASANGNARIGRLGALLLLCGALAACAQTKTHAPIPPPHTSSPPKAAPAHAANAAETPPYAQDTERAKVIMAKKRGESLGDDDVGYYMDVLQGRLRQSLAPVAHIGRAQLTLAITIDGGCEPAPRAQLDADARSALSSLAAILAEYRKTVVLVQTRDGGGNAAPSEPRSLEYCALAAARQLAASGVGAARLAVPHGTHATRATPSAPVVQRVTFILTIEPVTHAAVVEVPPARRN
jgi:hypothetical protein